MRTKLLLILLVIISLLASGCWNKREIKNMAIVMGAGFDNGQKGKVKVTVQIANPSKMKGAAGQSGGGGGSGESPGLVLSSQGETIFEAIRNFLSSISRKLFWSHAQVLIVGEKLAKQGVFPVTDFFERDPEPRVEVPFLVAKGEAEKILQLPGELENLSSREINQELDTAEELSKARRVDFHEFALKLDGIPINPVAPMIKIVKSSGKERYRVQGMAVFRKDKLVGFLNDNETRGYLWIIGKVKSGILVIKEPGKGKGKISLEIKKSEGEIKGNFDGPQPRFTINIKCISNIGEVTGTSKITTEANIKAIEKKQAKLIKKEVMAAVQKVQKLKSDILGFGNIFHSKEPKKWHKAADKWDENLAQIKVDVNVDSHIYESGDKLNQTATIKKGK